MAPFLRYDCIKGGNSQMKMPKKIDTDMFAPCGIRRKHASLVGDV